MDLNAHQIRSMAYVPAALATPPSAVVPMVIENTGRVERAFDIYSLLLKQRSEEKHSKLYDWSERMFNNTIAFYGRTVKFVLGHQVATLGHAIDAAAFGGTVFYFGVTDDDTYPISIRTMLRNNLTLKSGVTLDRRRMLDLAGKFAAEHPGLLAGYLTHTFGIDDVQAAFELACRPEPGRVKIALTVADA